MKMGTKLMKMRMIVVMPVPDSTRLLMFPVAQMNILIIKYNLYANLKMIGEKKKQLSFGPPVFDVQWCAVACRAWHAP